LKSVLYSRQAAEYEQIVIYLKTAIGAGRNVNNLSYEQGQAYYIMDL
jgi:hypothetical protein